MMSRLAATVVALGCIAAAGIGGYLAVQTAEHTSAASPDPHVAPAASLVDPHPLPASPRVVTRTADATQSATSTPIRQAPAARARETERPRLPAIPSNPVREAGAAASGAPPVLPLAEELPMDPVSSNLPADLAGNFQTSASILPPPPEVAVVPTMVEIELVENTVVGVRLDTTVSSETARVEDPVHARVTRDVVVDEHTTIPSGTRVDGFVTFVARGGTMRERARIGIRFTSIELRKGERVPVQTETIYRDGDPPAGEATAKIGASAIVGSILGGVVGGRKGAAIGGAAGAAGGTALVVTGDRNPAVLSSGTPLTLRLSAPVVFEIEP